MIRKILEEVRLNIDAVIAQDTPLGVSLWQTLVAMHPGDIAFICSRINKERLEHLFAQFPKKLKIATFKELSDRIKAYLLLHMVEADQRDVLKGSTIAELADLFEIIADRQRRHYFKLLSDERAIKVRARLKFDPESAAGIMIANVVTLQQDMTVEESIQAVRRLEQAKELHRQIYVTDADNKLVGNINLEDLVLKPVKESIKFFVRKNALVVQANEDREVVAQRMVRYHLTTVPVVDAQERFLGLIPSDELVDIIEREAAESLQRRAAMTPMKRSYFETSFIRLIYERGYILVVLLLVESFSGTIMKSYEHTLNKFLYFFIPMLISVGGNTSTQTSALVIQGMALGDINVSNIGRFLRRECLMGVALAAILGAAAFTRVYLTGGGMLETVTITLTLCGIVLLSVILGSAFPLLLRRFNVDPAFAAGPFLATLMDIAGILLYCFIAKLILFS